MVGNFVDPVPGLFWFGDFKVVDDGCGEKLLYMYIFLCQLFSFIGMVQGNSCENVFSFCMLMIGVYGDDFYGFLNIVLSNTFLNMVVDELR
jgi:hypothetical protein